MVLLTRRPPSIFGKTTIIKKFSIVQITCGQSSSQNCTHLVSPNYPNTYNEARTCAMTINRFSDTCQLRMDVIDFTSSQPTETGNYKFEYFNYIFFTNHFTQLLYHSNSKSE